MLPLSASTASQHRFLLRVLPLAARKHAAQNHLKEGGYNRPFCDRHAVRGNRHSDEECAMCTKTYEFNQLIQRWSEHEREIIDTILWDYINLFFLGPENCTPYPINGFKSEGVEMSFFDIAQQYLTSKFPPDPFNVSVDSSSITNTGRKWIQAMKTIYDSTLVQQWSNTLVPQLAATSQSFKQQNTTTKETTPDLVKFFGWYSSIKFIGNCEAKPGVNHPLRMSSKDLIPFLEYYNNEVENSKAIWKILKMCQPETSLGARIMQLNTPTTKHSKSIPLVRQRRPNGKRIWHIEKQSILSLIRSNSLNSLCYTPTTL